MNLSTMMRRPSAFIPVAMSIAALAIVLGNLVAFGIVHEADEGAAAHLFQLLLGAQIPIVAFFAIKWLPRDPRPTWLILLFQAGAALTALAPVFCLSL